MKKLRRLFCKRYAEKPRYRPWKMPGGRVIWADVRDLPPTPGSVVRYAPLSEARPMSEHKDYRSIFERSKNQCPQRIPYGFLSLPCCKEKGHGGQCEYRHVPNREEDGK